MSEHLHGKDNGDGTYTIRDNKSGEQATLRYIGDSDGGMDFTLDPGKGPFIGNDAFLAKAEGMAKLTKLFVDKERRLKDQH